MEKIELLTENTGDIALRRRARWLVKHLELKDGDKVLDVGCGDGYYLHLLSNLGIKLTLVGIDFDQNALNSARKNLKNKNIKLIQGDLTKPLKFKDSTFDKIIASEVLEHLPNPTQPLDELYRVLKKSGIIVVSVPHKNYPFFWDPVNRVLEDLFNTHIKTGFWAGIWNQHIRLFSEKDLKSLFKKANLNGIQTKTLTHYSLPFNHHLINLVARALVTSKSSSLKKSISKFKKPSKNDFSKPMLFRLVFFLDKLNDSWDGEGSAVSLVALGRK